ncbi:hypothetical protein [Mesorhizobium metallidurans]|uniref:hypothetical protein n=1 Tax=Mesorhizobium metallidurans TaxID=489722 RepID=UPI00058BBB55|nr:hypothetical protein [Mesorhizobium metallidurans]
MLELAVVHRAFTGDLSPRTVFLPARSTTFQLFSSKVIGESSMSLASKELTTASRAARLAESDQPVRTLPFGSASMSNCAARQASRACGCGLQPVTELLSASKEYWRDRLDHDLAVGDELRGSKANMFPSRCV